MGRGANRQIGAKKPTSIPSHRGQHTKMQHLYFDVPKTPTQKMSVFGYGMGGTSLRPQASLMGPLVARTAATWFFFLPPPLWPL